MNAEQQIKAALDGWFFRLDHNGVTRAVEVAKDYISTHQTHYLDTEQGKEYSRQALKSLRPWGDQEAETLFEMRNAGETWDNIASTLRRGIKTAREQYLAMCRERSVKPFVAPAPKYGKLPEKVARMVTRMRNDGHSLTQIAARTGLTYHAVRDYCAFARKDGARAMA